jgi:hypothetical protein
MFYSYRTEINGITAFGCNVGECDEAFSVLNDLIWHKKNDHKDVAKIRCGPCNLEYGYGPSSHVQYKDHLLSHKHAENLGEDFVAHLEQQK